MVGRKHILAVGSGAARYFVRVPLNKHIQSVVLVLLVDLRSSVVSYVHVSELDAALRLRTLDGYLAAFNLHF